MRSNEVILQVKDVRKTFGPVIALKGVSFEVRRGEIRGLIGENGSGKSTVTSIVAGMQKADSGEMTYQGAPWHPVSMIDAQHKGVSMILQEMNTISGVTVAENLFAGREDEFSRFGFVNLKKMKDEGQKLLDKFGIRNIRAADSINRYGFEDRKLIEIARSVNDDTQLLVVDETTTALSHEGRQLLYKLVNRMAAEGKAVIFISHDLDEIMHVCSVITVLRDGEIIGSLTKEEFDPVRIRYMMVGRDIGDAYYREDFKATYRDETVLEMRGVSVGEIHDFSLQVRAGEIVGIGGLSGCGMHDVGRAAFGIVRAEKGAITVLGKEISDCGSAIEAGVAYISKNRDEEALILTGSIRDNIVLPILRFITRPVGFIHPGDEKKAADAQVEGLRIKCNNPAQLVSTLSGGNKQKVSFAKWMATDSRLLIMDCPTRGVDVGVKQAMYQLIEELKEKGKAILIISEELAELIGMCDRIVIMKDFAVSKTFERSADLTETAIIDYMI